MIDLTVEEIREVLRQVDAKRLPVIERSLAADTRKGVRQALRVARRRVDIEEAEQRRLASLYATERSFAEKRGVELVLGLDEVGRGSLAGPLAVGAVVLPEKPQLAGLNDSKQVRPDVREALAVEIKAVALAWSVQFVESEFIDRHGMTASLIFAFKRAIAAIEGQGITPGLILLDGNPLRIDERECNVVKGDACCASIAAASIIAKVERDALMVSFAEVYPHYEFAKNKGYASHAHIQAIKTYGLTPIHRVDFCSGFTQASLF